MSQKISKSSLKSSLKSPSKFSTEISAALSAKTLLKTAKSSSKTSIRIVITDEMKKAFDRLRASRYSFMKEDEIIKLAFSKLYSQEYSPVSRQTSLDVILTKLREGIPNFGEKWMKSNDRHERELTVDIFCQMISDSITKPEDN